MSNFELNGLTRIRIVGSLQFERPVIETHDEFLIVHLKYLLGKEWGTQQVNSHRAEQHAIIQWLFNLCEEQRRILGDKHDPNLVVSAKPSGQALELLSVADDLSRLSLVDKLPNQLLERLRNRAEFQGVRYELALAASFVRAGFTINWLDELNKHAEFCALLPKTNEQILVEAKSRRRPGTLHEGGNPPAPSEIRVDVGRLYRKALEKNTEGKPFLIALDVNLPQLIEPSTGLQKWLPDVKELLDGGPEATEADPAKEFCLVFTNFNWHYAGRNAAPAHQRVYTFPQWCVAAPEKEETYAAIIQAIDTYGCRPEGVFT